MSPPPNSGETFCAHTPMHVTSKTLFYTKYEIPCSRLNNWLNWRPAARSVGRVYLNLIHQDSHCERLLALMQLNSAPLNWCERFQVKKTVRAFLLSALITDLFVSWVSIVSQTCTVRSPAIWMQQVRKTPATARCDNYEYCDLWSLIALFRTNWSLMSFSNRAPFKYLELFGLPLNAL